MHGYLNCINLHMGANKLLLLLHGELNLWRRLYSLNYVAMSDSIAVPVSDGKNQITTLMPRHVSPTSWVLISHRGCPTSAGACTQKRCQTQLALWPHCKEETWDLNNVNLIVTKPKKQSPSIIFPLCSKTEILFLILWRPNFRGPNSYWMTFVIH